MLLTVCCPLVACGMMMWCKAPQLAQDDDEEKTLVNACTPTKKGYRRVPSPDNVMATPEPSDVGSRPTFTIASSEGASDVESPQSTPPPAQAAVVVPMAKTESAAWEDAALFLDRERSSSTESENAAWEGAIITHTAETEQVDEAAVMADLAAVGYDIEELTGESGLVAEEAPPPELPESATDRRLRQAFSSADVDHSGALSKRQLYVALAAAGLVMTPSEQLSTWNLFDRNHDGRVEWEEFQRLGAVLLDSSTRARQRRQATPRTGGTFARRPAAEEQRLHRAAARIQSIARQRSAERMA